MKDMDNEEGKESEEQEICYENFQQPDGGFGWVIVIAAFSVQFCVLGTMNNFGILFSELLVEFNESKQATAWVGSITYGLMFMSGPIATSLCERIGCRPVAILGGIIGAVGTLLASFSNNIYKMYVTQGFLFGVGASLCYFPSVIILPQYFCKRLSMANGLVSCGSGVGTMAMGPIINELISSYGWRMCVRFSSVLMIAVSFISILYRPRIQPMDARYLRKHKKPLFDFSVFQNKAFLAFTFALFLFMLSYFVPFVHLAQMAVEHGVPMKKASLLIGFMSVSSTFGRLFFGKIADSRRINRLYVYQISLLGIGVANTLCPVMVSFPGFLIYCTIFGFFEGCYVCQCAVLTGDIVGRERMALGVGTLFGIKSIPLTLGPPLAGFLYDISNSYQVAFFVAGAVSTLAACVMFTIPFLMPPPDHSFWKHRQTFSMKFLLPSTSSNSEDSVDGNNNDMEKYDKNTTDKNNLDGKSYLYPGKSQSFVSIGQLYFDVEKKVSMRDIGSVSSLGTILISPNVKKASSNLIVVDRLTVV